MPKTVHPRRSALYMPGSNARALEKAKTLPADALIMDLEDAVAPDAKEAARAQVCEAIARGGYGRHEVVVRVNALSTSWGYQDIVCAARSGADAILLPKVESANAIRQAETVISNAGGPDDLSIWCMMETPRGILRAEAIAGASSRVACFVMGTSDLTKDLHGVHTRDRMPMVTSLGICMLVARAYGLSILDGVHLDIDDAKGFEASCRQGKAMGFDGKTLIHPKTIDLANKTFGPSVEEIEMSRRIISEYAAARKQGQGVVVMDGKLIENLHVVEAERLVSLADMIAAMDIDMKNGG